MLRLEQCSELAHFLEIARVTKRPDAADQKERLMTYRKLLLTAACLMMCAAGAPGGRSL